MNIFPLHGESWHGLLQEHFLSFSPDIPCHIFHSPSLLSTIPYNNHCFALPTLLSPPPFNDPCKILCFFSHVEGDCKARSLFYDRNCCIWLQTADYSVLQSSTCSYMTSQGNTKGGTKATILYCNVHTLCGHNFVSPRGASTRDCW